MNDLPPRDHNSPPDMAATAADTMTALSDWMSSHPVIQSMDDAREAKVFIDRGKLGIKDLEDEREAKVRPLNEQVMAINNHYRGPRELLRKVLDELQSRVSKFIRAEEEKRLKEAAEARHKAEEAEQAARDAERAERDALSSAEHGVIVDVASVTVEADRAFQDFEKASRDAAVAERESKVRIGGGFSRAIGLRSKETLILDDPHAAIKTIGLNDGIREAIFTAARAYKRLHGRYPSGVSVKIESRV